MTNTPHLRLHTWALTDGVSVAEMNENFTAIDEANARGDAIANLHESALIRTAYQSMKHALRAYREDTAAYDDTGAWLADFSKGTSEASEVSNLRLVEGCYVLPHVPQSSVTLNITDDHLDCGETRVLAEVPLNGFGTLERITVNVRGTDHSTIRFELYHGEEKLAQTPSVDVDDGGGTFAFETPVEVYPNMELTLRAHAANGAYSSAHIYAGETIELGITPCVHEEGWLKGRSFTAIGASQMLVWLWWTGEAPTLELLQNAHESLLTPVNQGTSRFLGGEKVRCAYYRTAIGAVGDISLRLHPQALTRLCGGTALCI